MKYPVLFLGAPGTIVAEYANVPLPNPEVPAMVAQTSKEFADCVTEVSQDFIRMLATPREQLLPVNADGTGHPCRLGGGS